MLSRIASRRILAFVTVSALAVTACRAQPEEKAEVTDEAAQAFSLEDTRIAGHLAYGQTSAETRHAGSPRYVAYELTASAGDVVDVWVRSPDGDPVAWILDAEWQVLAKNDDASSEDPSAHVTATLTARAGARHYVVVREYWLDAMRFTVSVVGKSAPADACRIDADCAKIEKGCCELGKFIAVRADEVAAYKAALSCPTPLYCPMIMVAPDHRVPRCNSPTRKCELVRPAGTK